MSENREREYHGNGWWPKTPVSNGSQQVRDLKTPEKLADLGGKQGGSHPERRPQKPVHASTAFQLPVEDQISASLSIPDKAGVFGSDLYGFAGDTTHAGAQLEQSHGQGAFSNDTLRWLDPSLLSLITRLPCTRFPQAPAFQKAGCKYRANRGALILPS
ncbi:hypothetical protein U0070_024855 [Myodes glareolus]|uniref:Uncharacterized protein n=1 Tax=Myodes glareolus TaxID=447135 RepID=A0AAW0HK29_MYOGA